MAKRRASSPLTLAVLACLAQRPMHPYEMATTMRDQHHDSAVKINFGSLYNAVETLRKSELIDVQGTGRQGNRPERTTYEITESGRDELAQRLRELLSTPAKEYTLLAAGLTFMTALAPDDVAAQLALRAHRLEKELEIGHEELRAHHEGADGAPPLARIFLVEDEYQLALKETELKWVRRLLQDINSEVLDGVADWRERSSSRRPR
ncbi:PadR family transcriptional regulator [Actinoalloteichus hymeniacidonis]|uniref:Transcriptional regulator, PadR family n=1 Tax=Actinoalloteichus hymeniacidonis TaxID=340345 RepID=A0AAC9HP22_9PSEU|nr:PadR family transcriptional regulator [Actinoalloteichus hymeniacidonis]AOS62914.1 transcriptional regulator, PadR family [Actinoalloteichus hymeniacidonis]MBB5909053.1 DNA-binding PadR family transcriptional regulator [Actinoalloteichus hymeniacidonis]